MKNKEILDLVKKIVKNKENISKEEFDLLINFLCNNVFMWPKDNLYYKFQNNIYECYLPQTVLIRWNNKMNFSVALKLLCDDIDAENFEWGILIHSKGVWLLNRDIELSDTLFGSKKTVFKILFSHKTDLDYLEFLNFDYLCGGNKAIYFFRDMITYKNRNFSSCNSNSWDAYWSCNKRFFYYYIKKNGGQYFGNKEECYSKIKLLNYEKYIREQKTIKTANSARNQFFYIKSFILSQAYNKEFDIGGAEILKRCNDILCQSNPISSETDKEKLAKIIKYLEKQQNGVRNKTLFLLLICFGMKRKKICALKWSDIDNVCKTLKVRGKDIVMPHVLQESFSELKKIKTSTAVYVFETVSSFV